MTKLLTDRQTAEQLGIGRSTLWRWLSQGKAPKPVRLNGVTRWRAEDILQFINEAAAAIAT
ncbi:helix-turn-helix domain-containing protein [Shimia thalassica]|uniref:helix-turn-helix transcriptional regulator n=1 Tax=Shimia thalassica TaxID=1715693 RepID=UPI001C093D7A|nr:helix-turn-helix domain-containing protein [Shimia thalassica]MBU2942937.1 helix-turn-helix domain-containing protein [Shimia thalassica]MDO6502740.1 helix-turn-helix domain-containing protein [Shimia thalassica]